MDTVPIPDTPDEPRWLDRTERDRLNRNLRIFAEQFEWPVGLVDQLLELEAAYPAWTMWYHKLASRDVPEGVVTASLIDPLRHYSPLLQAHTVEGLRAAIEAEEPNRVAKTESRL